MAKAGVQLARSAKLIGRPQSPAGRETSRLASSNGSASCANVNVPFSRISRPARTSAPRAARLSRRSKADTPHAEGRRARSTVHSLCQHGQHVYRLARQKNTPYGCLQGAKCPARRAHRRPLSRTPANDEWCHRGLVARADDSRRDQRAQTEMAEHAPLQQPQRCVRRRAPTRRSVYADRVRHLRSSRQRDPQSRPPAESSRPHRWANRRSRSRDRPLPADPSHRRSAVRWRASPPALPSHRAGPSVKASPALVVVKASNPKRRENARRSRIPGIRDHERAITGMQLAKPFSLLELCRAHADSVPLEMRIEEPHDRFVAVRSS